MRRGPARAERDEAQQQQPVNVSADSEQVLATRRRALGITAAATAGFLADRALAPEPASATEEVVTSLDGEHGALTGYMKRKETEEIAHKAARKEALESALVVAVGSVLTEGVPKEPIDGTALAVGDIVLLTGQAAGKKQENGLWEVKAGKWVRPLGYANGSEQSPGQFVPIIAGVEHAGSTWIINSPTTAITVGTTETTWVENTAGSGVVTGVIVTQSRTALGVEALKDDESGHFNTAVGYQALQNAEQERFTFTANLVKPNRLTGLTLTYKEVREHLNFGGFLFVTAHPEALKANEPTLEETFLGGSKTEEEEYNAKKELIINGEVLKELTGVSVLQLWGASYNTAVGYKAAQHVTTGSGNITIGEIAGGAITTGGENIAIGTEAMVHNTTEGNLIAIGFGALNLTTVGPNIGIGQGALANCSTGSYNLGIGAGALQHNESEPYNVVVGHLSCNNNNGKANTIIGTDCLQKATTASENTCVGWAALSDATGSFNTAVGYFTLGKLTTGGKNTTLGYEAGVLLEKGESNVFIGCEAGAAVKEVSNKLYIANSATEEPLIKGEFPNASLQLNAGKLGFNKKTPVTLIATNLETGTLKTKNTSAWGFESKAEMEKVIEFIEKWTKFMHECGLTA
jgi:hypothetical protein